MSTDDSGGGSGRAGAAISDGMVQMLRDYTGRGPTKARTVVAGDVVTCVMEDTLTRGERQLVERGERQTVLTTRQLYQALLREDAVALVESTLGRTVLAFVSGNHIDPDLAVETFVLVPRT